MRTTTGPRSQCKCSAFPFSIFFRAKNPCLATAHHFSLNVSIMWLSYEFDSILACMQIGLAQATINQQRRGLLVFSELPRLPSAGIRSGCYHTSLGCTEVAHAGTSGLIRLFKNLRKGNPATAYLPVSVRRRSHGDC
jgi:hypothetical protein